MFKKIDSQYVLFFLMLVSLTFIYKKLQVHEDYTSAAHHYKMVDNYLINPTAFEKPYLWIHLHSDNATIPEVNSRKWISFYSRDSKNFNQPYQYLTIKSIIDKCGDDFNIAIIDDKSFGKIIPNWKLDFSHIANPIKAHLRLLAMSLVLNTYGGIAVPSSFICFKSLKPLYDMNKNKMFVGEFPNNTSSGSLNNKFLPSTELMGCNANNENMKEFIKYLEILNSTDFVADMDLVGKPNVWLNERINNKTIGIVNGQFIGTQKVCGNPVDIEDLIGSTFIDLNSDTFGMYVPWDQFINRTAFQWFVQLTAKEVLESNTMIGKHLLVKGETS